MHEMLASYATRAAEKMRRYKVAADNLFVFSTPTPLTTIRPLERRLGRLPATSNDTGEVVALTVRLGERLFREGFVMQSAA